MVKHQMSEYETINSTQATKFASRIRKKLNSDPIIQQFSQKKEEKKSRRNKRLLLFELPESNSDSPAKRIKHDCVKVKNIYDCGLQLSASNIENMVLLGSRSNETDKRRPLLFQCKSEEKK